MANEVKNVTTAKPKVSGAVFYAPLGTTLPTDATTPSDTKFKNLGYVSEDGFTFSTATSSENIKEWGGTVVDSSQTEKSETAKLTLIEALNVDTLKFVFGESNVTANEKNITVTATGNELDACVFVVDTLMKNGTAKRIVIDNAKPILNGDVAYKANQAVGFPMEISCPTFHKEYITLA